MDGEIIKLAGPLKTTTDTYLNTFATNLTIDLDSSWSRMEATAMMNLLHSIASKVSNADITALPTPGAKIFIPKGLTSVRQFYALFANDDYLVRIQITGRQLRAYLERAANFYGFSYNPELFNKNIDPADFDTLEGCTYSLDISKPVGSRVVDLKVKNQPIKDTQILTMCLCSRRVAGMGGYLEAMNWSGNYEIISPMLFRNIILEHILSKSFLTIVPNNNWRIVPALDRERVLTQQP